MSNEQDPYRGAFQQAPPPPAAPRPPTPQGPPTPPSEQPTQVTQPPAPAPRPAVHYAPPEQPFQPPEQRAYPPEQRPYPPEQPVYQPEQPVQQIEHRYPQQPPAPWQGQPNQPGLPVQPEQPEHRPVPALREPLVPAHAHTHPPARPVALDQLDIKRRKVPAKQGWRGALYALARINLGPGKDESYELALQERVRRIVRTTFPVAVLNLKGGVGKTVVVEALGSTFAEVRGDRVIAVDLDTDCGNLIDRHGRESSLSIVDLVSDTSVTRYLDVRAHTSMNGSRLEVLDGPNYARTDRPIDRDDFDKALPILKEHYSLVLMDCGTGLKTDIMDGILREARGLVIVTSASIDAMRETDMTVEWLRQNGYQRLLESAILVINHNDRGKPNVDVDRAVEQWSRQIRNEHIVILPFDGHVHEGKEMTLELLNKKSRRRYLQIAALLADTFPKTAAE
jgi:MinD-like ATPase involved in chromosome partitioning or flagellar assembly